MNRDRLQMDYELDEAAYEAALAELRPDPNASDDHLSEASELPEDGEQHVAHVFEKP